MSVHWPIIRTCLTRPGARLVIDDRRSWRAGEMLVGAAHLADIIAARSRSRTVGVLLPTGGAMPMAALAAWMLGRTVVPLNYLLKPDELQYVIDDCGTDIVLTAEPLLEHMRSVGGRDPRVANLVRLDSMTFRGVPDVRWPSLRGVGDTADDLALLLYTSGTSGKPKGVMLSHRNLASNIRQCVDWVRFTRHDTLLGVLPQFHSFGMTVLTLLPMTLGCRVVYSARFVPANIVRLLREHRPTALVAIPSMYNALLAVKDAGPDDFTSLRFVVSGGEPLSEPVARAFRDRFNVTINEGYGLTETSPVTNWCRPHEYRPRSVGKPLPNVIERIVDPATGADLPPGQDGEVWIAGPNIMQGYLHLARETASALTPDGFLRTGDMGRFDADGHLYITGRIKEMIIVGGENVFPREIEEVLDAHPSVKASGVVGHRDDLRGETPVAFIELKEGAAPPPESELRTWCRARLAGYKVPTGIRVMAELPKGPTGKVLRRELHTIANAKP